MLSKLLVLFVFLKKTNNDWLLPLISSFHREATNQKLKIAEAAVRNQDKNAIMADSWYLPQNLGEHWDPWNWRRRSITAALEQAAANDRIDRTCRDLQPKCWFSVLTDTLANTHAVSFSHGGKWNG